MITSAACLNFIEKQLSLGPRENKLLVLPKESLRTMRDGIESCVSEYHRTYRCPDGKRDKVIKGDDYSRTPVSGAPLGGPKKVPQPRCPGYRGLIHKRLQ